jgi:IS5 family transposase
VVHSVTSTDAAAAELRQLPALLHGEEQALYGDRAYWSEGDRQACEAAGIRYRVYRRGTAHHPVSEHWRRINRARSRVRARGEHAFHVVKTLWHFTKVRYRGLAKNAARVFTVFALANLYLLRYKLGAVRATCLS